jgi:hypothetical protein
MTIGIVVVARRAASIAASLTANDEIKLEPSEFDC